MMNLFKKQIRNILREYIDTNIIEEEEGEEAPETSTPDVSTSDTSTSKWESGITRGPANPNDAARYARKVAVGPANPDDAARWSERG